MPYITRRAALAGLTSVWTGSHVKGSEQVDLGHPTRGLQATMFGVLDNGSDVSDALDSAISAALTLGRQLELPPGDLIVGQSKTFTITEDDTLRIWSRGDTRLHIGAIVTFQGTSVAPANLHLADAICYGDTAINIDNASVIKVGDIIYLGSDTPVDTGYGYRKQMIQRVAAVVGNTVYPMEPCNFDFSPSETIVSVFRSGKLILDNLHIVNGGGLTKRLDIRRMIAPELRRIRLEGPSAQHDTDVLLVGQTESLVAEHITCLNSRYSINLSDGTRNSVIRHVVARGCRHPIDANAWAFNTLVQHLTGVDNISCIECHPCFLMKYEDVYDVLGPYESQGGVVLRSIGGHVKRAVVHDPSGIVNGGPQSPLLLSQYQYIGQLYDRTYEDIVSSTAVLGAGDVRGLYVRNCQVPKLSIDGTSSRVSFVEVDDRSTGTHAITRVSQRTAPRAAPIVLTPTREWGAKGTPIAITGITRTRPGVVTATAHGFSNGDVVRIDGVVGMTEVNEREFTVANATTDTFELSGVDTTVYREYSKGGAAEPGMMMMTISARQVLYLGWDPKVEFEAIIRKTDTALGATSKTYPVKLQLNFGIQEAARRMMFVTLTAYSVSRGLVRTLYPIQVFQGSPSNLTLGAAVSLESDGILTAVVNNIAPHYHSQVTAAGGDGSQDYDQYYATFDIVTGVTKVSDPVNLIKIHVLEDRMAA